MWRRDEVASFGAGEGRQVHDAGSLGQGQHTSD